MSIIFAFLFILLLWLLGYCLADKLGIRSIVEKTGLSLLFSTFLFTFLQILLLHFAKIQINQYSLLSLSLLMIVCVALYALKNTRIVFSDLVLIFKNIQSSSKFNKIVTLLLFLLFIHSLSRNYFWPITDWDALALYDFRAQVVAQDGNFNQGVELDYFYQYPPYTSLLHTNLYLMGFDRAKIWYSFLYISFLLVFYSLLRRKTTQTLSLLGTLFLAINPMIVQHSAMAYTNLSYSLYLGLGLLYVLQWVDTRKNNLLIIGSTFIAASTWIRTTEPFWLIPLIILVLIFASAVKKRSVSLGLLTILSFVEIMFVKDIWKKHVSSILSQYTTQAAPQPTQEVSLLLKLPIIGTFISYMYTLHSLGYVAVFQRIIEVTSYFNTYIVPVFSAYLVPALIISIYEFKNQKIKSLPIILVIISYVALLYVGTLVFSFLDVSWSSIGGSANRMSMFFIPLFIYSIFYSKILQQWTQKLVK